MPYRKITEELGTHPEFYLDFYTADEELTVWGLPDDTGPYGCFDAKEVYEFLKEIYN